MFRPPYASLLQHIRMLQQQSPASAVPQMPQVQPPPSPARGLLSQMLKGGGRGSLASMFRPGIRKAQEQRRTTMPVPGAGGYNPGPAPISQGMLPERLAQIQAQIESGVGNALTQRRT